MKDITAVTQVMDVLRIERLEISFTAKFMEMNFSVGSKDGLGIYTPRTHYQCRVPQDQFDAILEAAVGKEGSEDYDRIANIGYTKAEERIANGNE